MTDINNCGILKVEKCSITNLLADVEILSVSSGENEDSPMPARKVYFCKHCPASFFKTQQLATHCAAKHKKLKRNKLRLDIVFFLAIHFMLCSCIYDRQNEKNYKGT